MIFLVSTVNSKFSEQNIDHNGRKLIVVNQGSDLYSTYDKSQFFSFIQDDGFGLSRSRNLAVESLLTAFKQGKLDDDLVVLCDDDVLWTGQSLKLGKKHEIADILIGKIKTSNGTNFKTYSKHCDGKKLSELELFSVSSVEIIFRNINVLQDVLFNESFGVGSKKHRFGGEEFLMLLKLKRLGKTIMYIYSFLFNHPPVSTGSMVSDDGYWSTRRALFKEAYRVVGLPIFILFWLKKALFSTDVKIRHLLKNIIQ